MLDPHTKHTVDAIAAISAAGSFVGTLMNALPVILSVLASAFAITWYILQIYWTRKDRKAAGK